MEKKITRLVFDDGGEVRATEQEPITKFEVNGEMALITWFRKGNCEYNPRYIAVIEYEKPSAPTQL